MDHDIAVGIKTKTIRINVFRIQVPIASRNVTKKYEYKELATYDNTEHFGKYVLYDKRCGACTSSPLVSGVDGGNIDESQRSNLWDRVSPKVSQV